MQTMQRTSRTSRTGGGRRAVRAAVEACEPRRLLADSTVTGTVYADANKDGVRQSGEAGLSGYTVYADVNYNGVKEASESSAVTNSAGFYSLSVPLQTTNAGVAIRLLNVPTSQTTAPAGGNHSGKFTTVSTAGNRNFGVVTQTTQPTTATVTGRVVTDANYNGVAEAGEAGRAAYVYADYDGDGVRDSDEPGVAASSSGAFSLTTKRATFQLRLDTATSQEVLWGSDLTVQLGTPTVDATAGGTIGGADIAAADGGFARVAPRTAELDAEEYDTFGVGRLYVWLDVDKDGVRDASESLTPYEPASPIGSYGEPAFGSYPVALPAGVASQIGFATSDAVGARAVATLTTTAAANASPNDAIGVTVPTTQTAVFGRVFTDANRNGVVDGDDATFSDMPAQYAAVYADYNNNQTLDAGEPSIRDLWDEYSTATRIDGYFYLRVDAGKTFALRVFEYPNSANVGFAQTVVPTYTVAERQTVVANLGVTSAPKVTGRVVVDANNNGVADAGEAGVTRAVVFADYNGNGVDDAYEPYTTYVAADGTYSLQIDSRTSVTIRVRPFSADDGVSVPSSRIVNASGGDVSGVNFVLQSRTATQPVSTVTGTVYADANKNGVRDAGEAGLAGYTVYADVNYNGVKEASEAAVVTDANGFYSLGVPLQTTNSGVAIRLLNVPVSQITAPAGGNHSGKFTTVSTAGNRNFGVVTQTQPTSYTIAGSVFKDVDRDGVKDSGEANFTGGMPRVYADYNGNGRFDSGDEPRATVNDDGTFTLTVRPGAFELRVLNLELPTPDRVVYRGVVQTTAAGAALARVDTSDASTRSGRQLGAVGASVVRVQPTLVVESVPGGSTLTPAQRAELIYRFTDPYTGWRDLNGNGTRDANEPSAQYFHQTYYDGDGYWAYSFVIADGESFRVGISRSGAVGAAAETIVAGTGRDGDNFYAADVQPNTTAVVGREFFDNNSNGVFDAREGTSSSSTGFDAEVFADYDYDGIRDADEPTARVTGRNSFEHTDLVGVFFLKVQPNRAFALRLSPSLSQSTPVQSIKFAQNTVRGVYDLGRSPDVGVVSGQVRNDANRDGVAQSGEGGLAGVQMFVDYDNDGTLDADEPTAITDASGYYAIQAKEGTYNVRIDQPDRYELAQKNGGYTAYPVGNLVYQTGAVAQSATVVAGSQRGGANFTGVAGALAVVAPRTPEVDANVKDTFGAGGPAYSWYDADGDGVRDANEPVTVEDSLGITGPFDPHYAVDSVIVPAGVASKIAFAPTNAVNTVAAASVTLTLAANATASEPVQVVVPNTQAGVFGRLFQDANGNGIRDTNESTYFADDVRLFADYNNNGTLDAGEPETYTYDNDSLSRDFDNSYFYLRVDPNRSFTLRALTRAGVTQPMAKSYTVAPNTIVTGANVGLR